MSELENYMAWLVLIAVCGLLMGCGLFRYIARREEQRQALLKVSWKNYIASLSLAELRRYCIQLMNERDEELWLVLDEFTRRGHSMKIRWSRVKKDSAGSKPKHVMLPPDVDISDVTFGLDGQVLVKGRIVTGGELDGASKTVIGAFTSPAS